ncbi:MAG: long-chain acyl-CoA synthetase [Solirubrobacteraceae bacterium]
MSASRSVQDRAAAQSGPLAHMLAAAAEELGDHAAVVHGGERISHAELAERVARLAHGLAARGLRAGDPVALVMRDTPAFVISFLAVAGLRAVAVPLNPHYKEAELSFCLRDCDVRAVIADTDKAALCRELVTGLDDVDVIAAGDAGPGAVTVESLMADHAAMVLEGAAPEDDAVMQYSAGCTGGAKRVPRTQGQLRFEADSLATTLGLTSADVVLSTLPLFHSYGMGSAMMAALHSGATLVILEDAHPFVLRRDHALRVFEQERVTVFPAVPFILRLLAEAPGSGDLSALRLCFSAASALPRPIFDAFAHRFGVPIRQLYGFTEAGAVTANVDDDPWTTWRSVGRPLDGVQIEVFDETGARAGPGHIGEIAVRSPALTRGYVGLDALNASMFRDGCFLTNDRGRLDDDGRLHITGRKRLLIDVKGDKVDPIEVEDVLAVHPKVREVVVVGVESGAQGEDIIKAVVVPDGACQERELIRFARERLSNYKTPQMVEFREEIPKSPSGEVLRKYLV